MLQVLCKGLLHELRVLAGVADEHVEQFVLRPAVGGGSVQTAVSPLTTEPRLNIINVMVMVIFVVLVMMNHG